MIAALKERKLFEVVMRHGETDVNEFNLPSISSWPISSIGSSILLR